MIENVQTVKAHDPGGPDEQPKKSKRKKLDKKAIARFERAKDWFIQEQDAQSDNRARMALAQNYIDGEQYTEEEIAANEAKGRSSLVYNLMGTTCRWITGTEKRTRVDYNVVGRGEEDQDSAENKTGLLKYLNDVNRGGYHRSKAFEDAVGAGLGWIDVGVRGDQGEEPLYERYENWRNIWHDRLAQEPDVSDGRYIFKARWIDLDTAQVYFPEFANELALAAEDHDMYFVEDEFASGTEGSQSASVSSEAGNECNRRQRVKIIECQYKEAAKCEVIRCEGPANKAIFNKEDPVLVQAAEEGELYPAIRQVVRLMLFVSGRDNKGGVLLHDGISPYWHNRFSLVPVWGYRRKKNGLPYGPADGLIDPQTDLNQRKNKSLHILNTSSIIMDKGAVDDVRVLEDEAARSDSIIEKNKGFELTIDRDKQLAQQHVELMGQDEQYINKAGGVTDENLGRQTNATSGKAIQARQDQGSTVNTDLFENNKLAFQIIGELKLSLIEQYYSEEKIIRIIGERGKAEFKTINADEGSSITDRQADFVVDEQAYSQSVRAAMFEQLFDMVTKLPPEIGFKMLDVVVDMSDVPMRETLVSRIRQINGMKDEDSEPTPEEIEQEQQEQQEQQAAKERQERAENANIGLIEAKAANEAAKAEKVNVDGLVQKIEILTKALEAAGILQQNPTLGQGADAVIEDVSRE